MWAKLRTSKTTNHHASALLTKKQTECALIQKLGHLMTMIAARQPDTRSTLMSLPAGWLAGGLHACMKPCVNCHLHTLQAPALQHTLASVGVMLAHSSRFIIQNAAMNAHHLAATAATAGAAPSAARPCQQRSEHHQHARTHCKQPAA